MSRESLHGAPLHSASPSSVAPRFLINLTADMQEEEDDDEGYVDVDSAVTSESEHNSGTHLLGT